MDCYGTDNAEQIVGMIDRFCRIYRSGHIHSYYFYQSSVWPTWIQRENGRDVFIKVRPPAETNPYLPYDRQSLETIISIMKWLAKQKYPCPRPIWVPCRWAKVWQLPKNFCNAVNTATDSTRYGEN